ncbi:MAG: hypothetical protein GX033_06160 [Firmicutes bacterium]|nr:hypothetical protein [Bacillota bacterium]
MQPINLLPDLSTRRRQRLQLALPRIVMGGALGWLLLLGIIYGLAFWQQNSLQVRLHTTGEAIQALEPVAQRVVARQELTQSIRDLQELITTNTRGMMVPTLDLLASLLPAQIDAQQIVIDQGRISLTCQSDALAPIGQLYTNLQQTRQFSSIQFGTISSMAGSGYTFTVTLQLREVGGYD